jgi:hypothetical protein
MVAEPPKTLDPDMTVDVFEAKSAASNCSTSSTAIPWQTRIGRPPQRHPDKDGIPHKMNFSRLPRNASKAADPDNDSTVDAKELKSAAHHPLVQILK